MKSTGPDSPAMSTFCINPRGRKGWEERRPCRASRLPYFSGGRGVRLARSRSGARALLGDERKADRGFGECPAGLRHATAALSIDAAPGKARKWAREENGAKGGRERGEGRPSRGPFIPLGTIDGQF